MTNRDSLSCLLMVMFSTYSFAQDAGPRQLEQFERQQLTGTYFSEGANGGDIDGDGIIDIVYGPYWFKGPAYTDKFEIYEPVPQDMNRYANNFFCWIYDFNGDRANDILVVGFPGTPAHVYENPGKSGLETHWKKHVIFDWVSNESPQVVNITGDERPELVCTRDGYFGFVSVNWDEPFGTWEFHPVSEQITAKRFGHGLGVGDINGDSRPDIIHSKGWFEQPEENPDTARWTPHNASFTNAYGGADMFAYDVDGDNDNDVVTSLAAHDFGLAWYEQKQTAEGVTFTPHVIMGSHRSENRYGVLFSELHSVNLVDMDGDGLKDIITGKTYYSHHKQSPMWDSGAVVYWFKLVRGKDGVDWIPYQADSESGIGRQLSVMDVNNDKLPDIIVGGMKGAHVLTHKKITVDKETWDKAQPKPYQGKPLPSTEGAKAVRGARVPIDRKTGVLARAIEIEDLKVKTTGGTAQAQSMANFRSDRWSGQAQMWWTGAKPGDTLTIDLSTTVPKDELQVVLTCARDYGIVQLSLDGAPLGTPIDLFNLEVVSTGLLSFENLQIKPGKHQLTVEILGANKIAVKAYMVGLDCIRFTAKDEKLPEPNDGVKPVSASGRQLNLDFETGTLADWTPSGDAFKDQPVRNDTVSLRKRGMRSAHHGKYWIGGFEKHRDAPIGTLTSVPFKVTHPFASFFMNGGSHRETRVELVRIQPEKVIFTSTGQNREQLKQIVADLRAHVGKQIVIRLVDNHRSGWGHVNFDHFRFHQRKPAPVTAQQLQLVDDNYPHEGLSAADAVAAMQVPKGFRVTVGAAEPAVKQPIAMALDERGRVWIAEAYEYPVRAKGEKGRDRILIFEDTNGDGVLDDRKVFIEGLNLISGLEVGFGGVWVGAAPYLLFIPDKNGDDAPDSDPTIVLDGWGFQDTHETLNAFCWGPDGWLYGCHGIFTHSLVGKPGSDENDRVPINAGIWRFHPVRKEFEVFAHGTSNPWGVAFNEHGQAFATACVIPHLFHIVQNARYQRQAGQHFNPHTYADITTIADHLHYLGATPHSGNNKSDEAGGGHAHAGAMIYLGGAWPDKYRNQLFMNNIHGQRLNMDTLTEHGSGFIGGHGPDFLLARDRSSQILNLRYGPDGQAWMIDWYDMQACHRREVGVHDRSNGRIYKIAYGDPIKTSVDLRKQTDLELARMTLEENEWYVVHSRRLLQERAASQRLDPESLEFLVNVVKTNKNDTRVLRGMWALHVTGQLSPALTNSTLVHTSPYVRAWTIQLLTETHSEIAPQLASQFLQMAISDPSPVVRLYLASATHRIPVDQRWPLIEALCKHGEDAGDHNLPLMYWYAAEPLAEVDTERALALALTAGDTIPLVRDFMLRRIGSTDTRKSLGLLVTGLQKADTSSLQHVFLRAIKASLRGHRQVAPPENWDAAYAALRKQEQPLVSQSADEVALIFGNKRATKRLQDTVHSKTLSAELRQRALSALVDADVPDIGSTLIPLVNDHSLARVAIAGLAQNEHPQAASTLLASYLSHGPVERRLTLGTLCSRTSYATELLNAIDQKRFDGKDLTADLVRQLQALKDPNIDEMITSVWGRVRETAADKAKMIVGYKKMIDNESPVDLALGRAVFAKTCQRCHTLYGLGAHVGPDLTGSNRSDLDYLLSNIVDPSSVMAKEYQQHIIATTNGRVITGILRHESESAVTVQTADSTLIVPTSEIDERSASNQSMMPENQLKQFSELEVKSLVAYLRAKKQTPILATAESAPLLFNGKDLTGWSGDPTLWSVEDGEIVGRTDGLKRNEWLVSDMLAVDFELSVDVKLTANEGNSGIQFRSEATGHSVSGYQADIGAGWWGKLYEEHGRKLLSAKSGEEHVRESEWNTYLIRARGSKIETLINGQKCVELTDPDGRLRGIFALQLHSGGKTEVRYKNFQLKVLKEQ